MTEPLTAAQIVKMIHPDLPPATAHFLLNEAKPLLEWIEAQAEELAKYKHLATTAIDDALALRAKLAALQCKDGLPELPSPSELNGASNSVMGFTEADLKAYASQAQAMVRAKMVAAPVAPAQPAQDVNAELVDCLSELCDIVEGVVEDKSSVGSLIDSFTTQPARTALANAKAAPVRIEKPITEARLYELYPKGFVTWESSERRENKFTEQMEYVPVTKTDFNFLKFARVIEAEHGIGQAKAALQQEQKGGE